MKIKSKLCIILDFFKRFNHNFSISGLKGSVHFYKYELRCTKCYTEIIVFIDHVGNQRHYDNIGNIKKMSYNTDCDLVLSCDEIIIKNIIE